MSVLRSSDRGPRDATLDSSYRLFMQFFKLDPPLLLGILVLAVVSAVALYSASGLDIELVMRQGVRFTAALVVLLLVAQLPSQWLKLVAPWLYIIGILMLLVVLIAGDVGKGAQRWLSLGVIRFQPSELMKIAVPLGVAWLVSSRPLPPRWRGSLLALSVTLLPAALIARQPDLGTALLVACSGCLVLLLCGIQWRLIAAAVVAAAAAAPLLWHQLHAYQRDRVMTFLNPEQDPLDAGYHIIQSKIAIGSGGIYGKGWMNGTQSQLDFLPERATDFIFAVVAEEFGFFGAALLVLLYLIITLRGLTIALRAKGAFERLLAGSISLTFFVYVVVNIGMVVGLLPVVGVPLPLVSYGGTSMLTLMMGFGIVMSISADRRLLYR